MNKNRAFTLIELLVVISIIALLLAIVMPSMNMARERARRIVCASNIRQIAIGLDLYTKDSRDRIPPDTGSVMTLGGRAGLLGDRWGTYAVGSQRRLLNPYCGGPFNTPLQYGSVEYKQYWEADSETPLFSCPSDKGDPTWNESDNSYRDYGSSYIYNTYWNEKGQLHPTLNGRTLNKGKYTGLPMSQVRSPSRVVFSGDHALHNYYGGGNRNIKWHDTKKIMANVVFLDSHTAYIEVEPGHTTSEYTFLPQRGWLEN